MSSCPAPARSPICLCEEIKSKLGIKRVRGDTFGYLQRSFAGCASDVDRREAREVGEFAVKQAIWGAGDGSVAIRRIGDYAVDYALVSLAKVGGKTKVMADAFIAPSGSDVTPAFQEYLRPLLGSDLPRPPVCAAAPSPRCWSGRTRCDARCGRTWLLPLGAPALGRVRVVKADRRDNTREQPPHFSVGKRVTIYRQVELFDLADASDYIREPVRSVALVHASTVDASAMWEVTVGIYDWLNAAEEWDLHRWLRENGATNGETVVLKLDQAG